MNSITEDMLNEILLYTGVDNSLMNNKDVKDTPVNILYKSSEYMRRIISSSTLLQSHTRNIMINGIIPVIHI
jgi:hypothetical protein